MANGGFGEIPVILSPIQISQSLSLQDVKRFLESLGVEQIEENEHQGYLCCPTICHNPLGSEASMKLYWYQNNHCFRCYTQCNETMSIFELYRRFMDINYHEISMEEAIEYIKSFISGTITPLIKKQDTFEEEVARYKFNDSIEQLPAYSETVLECFSNYHCLTWKNEGITDEVMTKFKIKYWPLHNVIIIPHYDINNRMIGIRGRFFNEEDIIDGKYRPIQVGNCLYSHQLKYNLYGINYHKEAIKKRKSVIIAEAEKSVMLDDSYYGEYSNCVACCGYNFNKYQISLVTDILGANEIIVAFDKEYKSYNDDKAREYRKKIESLCAPYRYKANFSYIYDTDNLLKEKDSPFDRGKEVFEHLYKKRIRIR